MLQIMIANGSRRWFERLIQTPSRFITWDGAVVGTGTFYEDGKIIIPAKLVEK